MPRLAPVTNATGRRNVEDKDDVDVDKDDKDDKDLKNKLPIHPDQIFDHLQDGIIFWYYFCYSVKLLMRQSQEKCHLFLLKLLTYTHLIPITKYKILIWPFPRLRLLDVQ